MGVNYQNNNLHAMITFGEIEAFKRPGLDVQARIDSTAELLIVIRADLKNKYDKKPCSDLGLIDGIKEENKKDKTPGLIDRILNLQDRVDIEIKSNGMPYMDNETRNAIIKEVYEIRMELLEIAAREDLFDRASIPSGAIQEPEGVRRLKPGVVAQ